MENSWVGQDMYYDETMTEEWPTVKPGTLDSIIKAGSPVSFKICMKNAKNG